MPDEKISLTVRLEAEEHAFVNRAAKAEYITVTAVLAPP